MKDIDSMNNLYYFLCRVLNSQWSIPAMQHQRSQINAPKSITTIQLVHIM